MGLRANLPLQLALGSLVATTSCARESLPPDVVYGVLLDPPKAVVALGASTALTATPVDASGGALDDRTVHWSVEDPTVLRVTPLGVVTGLRLGQTRVAASAGGRSAVAEVGVVPVAVASVQVTPTHLSLGTGQIGQLTAQALDASGAVLPGRPVSWSSNNPAVATVSARGVVTARAIGGAIITATSEGKSAPAAVTVSSLPSTAGDVISR